MIKRTQLNYINQILLQNPTWKILDIGCGYSANSNATTIADVQDLKNYYKDKNFVKINEKKLPFKDKEFDFVISSQVVEHVDDVSFFLSELERVSLQGYIEVPTKLEDNLVFENKNDHIWFLKFDDIKNEMLISKRIQFVEPILSVSSMKKLNKYFRESFTLELYWKDKIDYRIIEDETVSIIQYEKISRIKLLKKFFSKSIRVLIKKIKPF